MYYLDSYSAIKLILEFINVWHHYDAILHNIKEFLSRKWCVPIFHIIREENVCADYLAKHGVDNDGAYRFFMEPHVRITILLLANANRSLFFK